MFARIRSIWLAGGGAVALAVTLSGVVAAATVLTAIVAPAPAITTTVADTTATFEDLDGNGIDDDCQTDVVADPVAAASAEAAADLNGDGTISVTEAAQSGRLGGKNCNHGGYVSTVARGSCDATAAGSSAAPDGSAAVEADPSGSVASGEPEDTSDGADTACTEATSSDAPTECVTDATAPSAAPSDAVEVVVDPAPNAHGKAVSGVAQSDAIGGKNCNHGGAVSEAAKKDHDAAKAARDAAKLARAAAREARQAAREAARQAAREAKQHGRHGG